MSDFFNKYFNIKTMMGEKKKYKQMMARVEALPKDYKFVYKKIQNHMWCFASGDGYDMLNIQYDLIDLFEAGVADGKAVLEVTGEDVATFVDELMKSAKTYTENWRQNLNNDIINKVKNGV